MKKQLITVLLVLFSCGSAMAAKYDFALDNTILNSEFSTIVREAGMLTAYRAVAPAEPGGITGFDFGLEFSAAEIDNAWTKAFLNNDAPDYLGVFRLHARKGLPFNLDIGASYLYIPESDVQMLGGEVQWAILDGTAATPALALRGHYSTLLGTDEVDLTSYGADAVLSKGFAFLTPYVGAGVVQIDGKYAGNDPNLVQGGLFELQDQSTTEYRGFAGCQITMALVRLTLEAEFSDMPVYTAKLSLGW